MPRKAPEFDLSTPCTLCGYKIHPSELVLTGFEKAKCPKCGREFAVKMPDRPHRTS